MMIQKNRSQQRASLGVGNACSVRIHSGVGRILPVKFCEINTGCLAPRHGFEPRFTAPKAAVLPLDDRGKSSEARPLSVTQPSANLKDLAGTSRSRIDQRPK